MNYMHLIKHGPIFFIFIHEFNSQIFRSIFYEFISFMNSIIQSEIFINLFFKLEK